MQTDTLALLIQVFCLGDRQYAQIDGHIVKIRFALKGNFALEKGRMAKPPGFQVVKSYMSC